MKLHILSDLHLNVAGLEAPKTDADAIVLAGDIARPNEAMAWATSFERPVVYVPGNHEFYGGALDATLRELKRLGANTRVKVLDCDEIVLGDVRFLGATLWTDFLLFGEGEPRDWAMAQARLWVRDFSRIHLDEKLEQLFSPAAAMGLFARHAAWLQGKLDQPFPGPTVVVTHHAPSPQSLHPRFANAALSACFVSDVEYLMGKDRVALWVHGHTHDSFDYTVNGTRVVCNPRGYAKHGVNENAAFDPELVVEVGRGGPSRRGGRKPVSAESRS
ncbi:MAG TPA: metallophosphoesterase family protein [Candidatus Competibacter sp.]|nr:metallophosphoesterase [Candidatus Competibacteraceae bacterium]HRC71701.1 metallophosphoesterase family protein [Candidatus Competibacter sp.]